jgi:glycosyltransferase involved in cell wall biosynthesis
MDGLEYKRTKFNRWVRKFLYWEEQEAVKHSRYLIADNLGIANYYNEKYGKECKYLAYGADIYSDYDESLLDEYGLTHRKYCLLIARLEPENNVEMVVKGYIDSDIVKVPLVIVGKSNTKYGKYLVKMYGNNPKIIFLGGIYDFKKINSIRYFSKAYFHGHSVGGTNPSLLEAMASSAFIIAHDNVFNKSVLGDASLYFKSEKDIEYIVDNLDKYIEENKANFVKENLNMIRKEYSWESLLISMRTILWKY